MNHPRMAESKLPTQERRLVLQTRNLSIGYADRVVMNDLNLEAYSGKFVCFMGPNGIGKSTLIRTLAGVQQPVKGQVATFLSGKPAVVLTDRVNAGYMTVRQLITFGRYPHLSWNLRLAPADRHAIESAISILHLETIANRRLTEISDGQLQLAQIGRALAQETNLVLLDEPTAHLDLNNRLEICLMLRRLARDGHKAIVMATHELDLALQTADEIWLAGGEQLVSGAPEDLVLSGAFDEIFKLKGFNLKTGKVRHVSDRAIRVSVEGNNVPAAWTRNALERSGYEVVAEGADLAIVVTEESDAKFTWSVSDGREFTSIDGLLKALEER